jgi:predicted nucleic acid-binding protein
VILVDTSIWIDHLRKTDTQLQSLLMAGQVLAHPFVIGELALGNLKDGNTVLEDLQNLPAALVASDGEVLRFIVQHTLHGLGIGYIDVHLLAAVKLTPDTMLWTRDRRLKDAATRLQLAAEMGR